MFASVSVPNILTGCGTPIDWCAESNAPSAGSPPSSWRQTRRGITVENRNASLGLRGIQNSVTRFHDVRVQAENIIEGRIFKIALTTLKVPAALAARPCALGPAVVPASV